MDNRPRWTANRINNTSPNIITSALVMGNKSIGSAWNVSGSLSKSLYRGLSVRGCVRYGEGNSTIDRGPPAFSSVANNQISHDPNKPRRPRLGLLAGPSHVRADVVLPRS